MTFKQFLHTTTALFILTFLNSCKNKTVQSGQILSSHSDSLWIDFLNAMERKDINYLIKNSLDSIECADCNLDSVNDKEFYESSFIFKSHLDKLMHLSDLKNREFQTAEDEKQLQIIYSVKSKYAEEGAYSLIFLFDKTSKGLLFKGMLVT